MRECIDRRFFAVERAGDRAKGLRDGSTARLHSGDGDSNTGMSGCPFGSNSVCRQARISLGPDRKRTSSLGNFVVM